MASIAESDASKLAKLMKAKPCAHVMSHWVQETGIGRSVGRLLQTFDAPVSGSRMTLGCCKMTPNALNVSYSSFSSTSGSRLPINKLAPTVRALVCCDACTRE